MVSARAAWVVCAGFVVVGGCSGGGKERDEIPPEPADVSGWVAGVERGGVTMTLAGRGELGPLTVTTVTDAAGHYAFDGLAGGFYDLTPRKTGLRFSPRSTEVYFGGEPVVVDAFTSAAALFSISGQLGSADCTGYTIALGGPVSAVLELGADCSFAFSGLAPGSYTLTATVSDLIPCPDVLEVEVIDDDVVAAIRLLPPYELTGTVSGPVRDGVTVSMLGAYFLRSTETDGEGRYRFRGLLEGGPYWLWATAPGVTFTPQPFSLGYFGPPAVDGVDFTGEAFEGDAFTDSLQGAWRRWEGVDGEPTTFAYFSGAGVTFVRAHTRFRGVCDNVYREQLSFGSYALGEEVIVQLGSLGTVTARPVDYAFGDESRYDLLFVDPGPEPDRLYEGDTPWSGSPAGRPTALGEGWYLERR